MKKEYLIKTLSRTKRKDYENYVINRLYNELNDLEIKPMSQKWIPRKESYALIDLYFPQLNIGIEIDEPHHLGQEELDKVRTEDIISRVNGYDEQRIIVSNKTIEEINENISKKVKYIKNKKIEQLKTNIFKEWLEMPVEEYFKDKEKITIDDEIEFATINEASNTIFGTNYAGQQQSYFTIKTIEDKIMKAWFPQLAIEKDGKVIAQAKGWNNTLNDEKDEIVEYHEGGKYKDDEMNEFDRVTFMKIKDIITGGHNYKFLGVFRPVSKKDGKVTYKRIATEFDIIRK